MTYSWDDVSFFKPSDFDSPDEPGSGAKFMSLDLVRKLESLRIQLGAPLRVTSGYRSPFHNIAVGGAKNSAHLRGNAVDVYCDDNRMRYRILKVVFSLRLFNRIEICPAHLHLDIDTLLDQDVCILNPKP